MKHIEEKEKVQQQEQPKSREIQSNDQQNKDEFVKILDRFDRKHRGKITIFDTMSGKLVKSKKKKKKMMTLTFFFLFKHSIIWAILGLPLYPPLSSCIYVYHPFHHPTGSPSTIAPCLISSYFPSTQRVSALH
jgi:hypothetical protein